MRRNTTRHTSPDPNFGDLFTELADVDLKMDPDPHLQTIFDTAQEMEKMSTRLMELYHQVKDIDGLNTLGRHGLTYASKKVLNAARDLLIGYQPPPPIGVEQR